jgi:hypothetical protein
MRNGNVIGGWGRGPVNDFDVLDRPKGRSTGRNESPGRADYSHVAAYLVEDHVKKGQHF